MENKSGIYPQDNKVLIYIDEAKSKKTKGGLFIPETMSDKLFFAETHAVIVDVGCNAFLDIITFNNKKTELTGEKTEYKLPTIGDKVLVGKFSGDVVLGKDGLKYRLIKDADIWAVIDFTKEEIKENTNDN